METSEDNSWVSQANVCRCCLSAAGTHNLTESYVTDSGIKVIYRETLQQCFGISLTDSAAWNTSRLICNSCIGHIHDADTFRKQVLRAERQFIEYWCNKVTPTELTPKTTCEQNLNYTFDDGLEVHSNECDGELLKNQTETCENRTYIKPEKKRSIRKKRATVKIKRKQKETHFNEDYDSDTPIAKFTKKFSIDLPKVFNEDGKRLEILSETKENLFNEDTSHFTGTVLPHVQTRKTVKNTSERKRVMVTCGTILRDTTACPFRHHKSWFQCFFCSQEFMEISLLRDHNCQIHPDIDEELKKIKRYPRSLQIEISNLECRHCNLNLTDIDSMRRHFVEVHNKIIYNECIADYKVNRSPYTCHICKKEFHVFRTLTTHLNEHYANCICDICGKSFINSKRLKVHKRTHESGQYPCKECGKVLKTKTSKANHMESVHAKRVLKCQICFEPMKHYNDRVKHMSDVHNITYNFKCHICSREYNIKHYLATHIRQTHGHKNKKCAECGMAFITNHGLKKHMAKHTGEKPFKCNICFKAYARSYTLKDHMRGHENESTIMDS